MNTATSLTIVGFALGASFPGFQEPTELDDLGAVLREVLADVDVPGIGAAIVTSEGLVALGVAGVRERGSDVQIRADDRFHIGSCTKAMTATLVALAVEAGKLRWDTTLAEALPELAETMDEAWRGATVAQLLSHTSGMTNNFQSYAGLWEVYSTRDAPMPEVRRTFVAGLLERPPLKEPGTRYAYSNYGYVTLGAILERLEAKPWEELIREQLFAPLGMTESGFGGPEAPDFAEEAVDGGQDDEETVAEVEDPHQPRGHFAGGRIAVGFDNVPALGPAGRVHCTLTDWAKFARLHLRGARGEEGLLLQPSTFAALHAAAPATAHLRNWRRAGYASGWAITSRPWSKGDVLTHDGSNTAWFAVVWIAPEQDFAVLVSCNHGSKLGEKTVNAAAEILIAGYLKARASSDSKDD